MAIESEIKQIKTFFRVTLVLSVLLPCGCGLIPVDDRSRFTMRTQNVLIVMKYKQARRSRTLCVSHTLFRLSLNSLFGRRSNSALHFIYFIISMCVCVRNHSLGSLCWLSQTSLIFIQSFSFSLTSLLFVHLFYADNLLKHFFLSLQRLNFINSNKTDKIKINGILWRNDERNRREKTRR